MAYSKASFATMKKMMHGVFLSIFDKGVLITGPAGCGKSDCALALIDRGHRLIADDAPCFYLADTREIIGFCPDNLSGLLATRALGLIDIKNAYGQTACESEKKLSLILALDNQAVTAEQLTLLKPQLENEVIFDVPVSKLRIALRCTQNLAIIVENAVRLAFSLKSPRIEQLLLTPCD